MYSFHVFQTRSSCHKHFTRCAGEVFRYSYEKYRIKDDVTVQPLILAVNMPTFKRCLGTVGQIAHYAPFIGH